MKFEVIGTPVAKGRPRVGKFGTFTPQKTVLYENLVSYTFTQKYPLFKPLESELKLKIIVVFEVPKSWSKKKQKEALPCTDDPLSAIGKTTKPDLDNIVKSITDALNGLAYKDDAQITSLLAHKVYGEQAKVIIEIEEM